MRYLMFPLTALFLLACGDTDNPVVPTAPAGKATVDLSAEECAAAESLPDGFLEQALEANADLAAEHLLTTYQAHGCADWALWGLIWLASLDADLTFDVEVYETPELLTDFSHVEDGPPRIDEVRIPPLPPLDEDFRGTSEDIYGEDNWRRYHLAEAGALSTVTVSSARKETRTVTRKDADDNTFTTTHHYAVFTFTRTGGHLDENLAVTFGLYRGDSHHTIGSGFSPGSATFKHEVEFTGGQIYIDIEKPYGGNYLVGDPRSASVFFDE